MDRLRPVVLLATLAVSACSFTPPNTGPSLQPFSDQRPLEEFVRKAEIWSDESYVGWGWSASCADDSDDCDMLEEIVVTGMKKQSNESITNNQEAGVDEGDIVKRVGDYIVMLRRGRLFTFALPTGGMPLRAIDYVDVAPPGEDIDAWYDEILNYGNTAED